jgi:hypothetical protein
MALTSRAAWPALMFWLIAEKWRLYTAGRRRKQGAVAIAQGPELGLTAVLQLREI